ncbi:hypothetical protein GQS40_10090|uniref:Asn/Gln amidotransferase domain-containing protein n=1 Tax=Leuconostoc lactis TaxID=1246 RepID=A0A6L7A7B3_LEULA|nr:hypothetical protein [Leuconostoc lactis]
MNQQGMKRQPLPRRQNLCQQPKKLSCATGFLIGQLMKMSKGQANPTVMNKLLLEELAKR